MMRLAAVFASGVFALGAITVVASDSWLAAGYTPVLTAGQGGTESDWLRTPTDIALKPVAVTAQEQILPQQLVATTKAFGLGTRLLVKGAENINLEVVSAVPAPNGSGLVDGEGRPLVVVTARERNGARIVRLLVEADRLAAPSEKSL